jgi:hypothetical protein
VESLAAVQVVIDHARRLEGLESEASPAGNDGPAGEAGDQTRPEARG